MATAYIDIMDVVKGHVARKQMEQIVRLLRKKKESYAGLKHDEIELILTMIDDVPEENAEE